MLSAPLKDELASFCLIYGTPGVPESVQALVEEEIGCNPGMLTAWHRSWCAIVGKKPRRPLEEAFRSDVQSGRIFVLGDMKRQQHLLSSNPGGLPASESAAPGKSTEEAGSGEGNKPQRGAAGEEVARSPSTDEKSQLSELAGGAGEVEEGSKRNPGDKGKGQEISL